MARHPLKKKYDIFVLGCCVFAVCPVLSLKALHNQEVMKEYDL